MIDQCFPLCLDPFQDMHFLIRTIYDTIRATVKAKIDSENVIELTPLHPAGLALNLPPMFVRCVFILSNVSVE